MSWYGWQKIVDGLDVAIEAIAPGTKLFIKEKFGTLRIYSEGSGEHAAEVIVLIQKAEAESEHICEACGRPGELQRRSWWKTLCKDHAAAYYGHGWRWWVDGFEEDGITAKLPEAKNPPTG